MCTVVTRYPVLLPLPLSSPYSYTFPLLATEKISLGTFVRVALRNRVRTGVVWYNPVRNQVTSHQLKPILDVLSIPSLPEVVIQFVEWVAAYTLYPLGAVLKMVISVPEAIEENWMQSSGYFFSEEVTKIRCNNKQRKVLETAAAFPGMTAITLAHIAETSLSTIRRLTTIGLLQKRLINTASSVTKLSYRQCLVARSGYHLSDSQKNAAIKLISAIQQNKFSVILLEGGTGSGKTEVYFEAIAEVLKCNRQILVLLPEIALTPQWLECFSKRFNMLPATWHSDLTAVTRRNTWRAVAIGQVQIVVGARSALFLPYPNLGLIVVDEEHEQTFKQEEGVVYHARDMAVVRGQLGKHVVILVSATPSLETRFNVHSRRYKNVVLKERYGGAQLPSIAIVDMRRTPPERGTWGKSWIAPPLVTAIDQTLASGEQILLFLNRRGYAPVTLCYKCGFRFCCPNCTAWLVNHRYVSLLRCHHCGYTVDLPRFCPCCGSKDCLTACGPGVERIAEEIVNRFPSARLALMTSDNVKGQKAASALVKRVITGDVDMLIGTQIVAQGHHFPKLTLVGVIDADLGLVGGDLRAAERTFQLLSQVAGRAGRADRPGRALIQTYMPTHPVINALLSGQQEPFYKEEAIQRQRAGMPPFGRLAALIVSSYDEAAVMAVAQTLADSAPRGVGVTMFGPAPALLTVLRHRYRYRLLLKTDRTVYIQGLVQEWLTKATWPNTVKVQIDVDPYSFW